MEDSRVNYAIDTLWQFMSSQDEIGNPKSILVFGSTDLIIAAFAAAVYFQTRPEAVICSGGLAHQHDLLNTGWQIPEGEAFASVLSGLGVPENVIFVESKATNTGENFTLSVTLAEHKALDLSDVLVIHKPYMTLRTRLTGRARYPAMPFRVASPCFTFAQYSALFMAPEKLINIMVGDLQRIIEYPNKGLSAPCLIPESVTTAFRVLIQAGYTKHLLMS